MGSHTVGEAPAEIEETAPDVDMPSGILVTSDGAMLWSRSSSSRRPMASTTKIMTALLVLEESDLDDEVSVSAKAAAVGGSGVYLRAGETLTVHQLLLALMLESSNSAAVALGEHVAGSLEAFVEKMNARADELGLADTRFQNPHGLDDEGHYTTATDLATLTLRALSDARFRELAATSDATIPGNGSPRKLESSNELLGVYVGCTGVKTGWTNPSGYCLVASADRDGLELVAVVLGAADEDVRFREARELLDWGFAHYRLKTLASVDETVTSVAVSDYLDREVVARVGEGAEAYVLDLDGGIRREYEVFASVDAPVEEGEKLGTLRAYQGETLLGEVPLVADAAVPEPGFWQKLRIFLVRTWRSWFGEPDEVS